MAKSIISSVPKDNIVVIGNGMVGHHFVQQLRAQSPDASIRVTQASGKARLPLLRYLHGHATSAKI